MRNRADSPINGHTRCQSPPAEPAAARSASGPSHKRDGPGNPGRRATTVELEERVIIVARLLCARRHKCQIKQYLATKYGLGARSAEIYISRAREWMLRHVKKSRDELISEALGFYEEILRDPEAELHRKMDAQLAIRQMMGLDKPFKIAPTTPDGGSPYVSQKAIAAMSDEELAVLRKLHLRIQQQRLIDAGEAAAADESNSR
jgi:hypothetical protein